MQQWLPRWCWLLWNASRTWIPLWQMPSMALWPRWARCSLFRSCASCCVDDIPQVLPANMYPYLVPQNEEIQYNTTSRLYRMWPWRSCCQLLGVFHRWQLLCIPVLYVTVAVLLGWQRGGNSTPQRYMKWRHLVARAAVIDWIHAEACGAFLAHRQ